MKIFPAFFGMICGHVERKSARCAGAIRSSISMARAAFNKKKNIFTSRFGLHLSKG